MINNITKIKIPGGNVWSLFLLTFAGNAILNRGFAYIGYYPIFIGEVTLLFYLLKLRHNTGFPMLLRTTAGKSILILFYYCLTMFVIAAFKDPGEALRNSIFWVYILNFYIGWRLGRALHRRGERVYFERFLVACAIATTLYYLLFPLRQYMLTATLYTKQGGGVALLGYYSTLHAVAISIVLYPIYFKQRKLFAMVASVGLAAIIFISQSRGAILALGSIALYLLFTERHRSFYRIVLLIFFFSVFGAILFSAFDLSIKGERGEAGIQIVLDAASSIVFDTDLETFSGSRSDRLMWWVNILKRSFGTWKTALFGLGLDQILLDRETSPGNIIRYPHNSYVTVFGHVGIIGLVLYLNAVAVVVRNVFRVATKGSTSSIVRWYPVFAIGWLVSAFFSTVFEAPFHSFVFWSMSGIAYYLAGQDCFYRNYNLKNHRHLHYQS